jgi:hypothetical protein
MRLMPPPASARCGDGSSLAVCAVGPDGVVRHHPLSVEVIKTRKTKPSVDAGIAALVMNHVWAGSGVGSPTFVAGS